MYETIRIVGKLRPKYVMWENVKNLIGKKHKHNFDAYIETMNILGYNSYYQVLNAKDCEIPQNRERVYTISIRKDIDKGNFIFPEKEELKLRLKDMLEDEIEEKYYLKDYQIENIKNSSFVQKNKIIQEKDYCDTILSRDWKDPKCVQVGNLKGGNTEPKIEVMGNYSSSNHDASRIVNCNGLAPTVKENHGTVTAILENKILIKNATKQGYLEAVEGDSINLSYPNSNTRRGRVGHQVSQTLMANDMMGVVVNKNDHREQIEYEEMLEDELRMALNGNVLDLGNGTKIRKLTPKECWRLMRI